MKYIDFLKICFTFAFNKMYYGIYNIFANLL